MWELRSFIAPIAQGLTVAAVVWIARVIRRHLADALVNELRLLRHVVDLENQITDLRGQLNHQYPNTTPSENHQSQ